MQRTNSRNNSTGMHILGSANGLSAQTVGANEALAKKEIKEGLAFAGVAVGVRYHTYILITLIVIHIHTL